MGHREFAGSRQDSTRKLAVGQVCGACGFSHSGLAGSPPGCADRRRPAVTIGVLNLPVARPYRLFHVQCIGNKLESRLVSVLEPLPQWPKPYLWPRARVVMVSPNEGGGEGVKLGFSLPRAAVPTGEIAMFKNTTIKKSKASRLSSPTGNPRAQSVAYRLFTCTRTCGAASFRGRCRGSG